MAFDYKMKSIVDKYLSQPSVNKTDFYGMMPLSKTSDEYRRLSSNMEGEFNKQTKGIYKIHNPILNEQFQVTVTERSIYGPISIKELMHCTAADKVNSILLHNLDRRLSRRVKFGHGVSFSTDPAYANLQSSLKNGTDRAMIICDVIVGNKHIGDANTYIPNESYDTTTNASETVLVKYYDHEFYPKYAIFYESCKVKSSNGQRYYVH